MSPPSFRIERDSMGELNVPSEALWGAQTQRAVDNFPISGLTLPRGFIRALALIKQAAAAANAQLGLLAGDIAAAIQSAARQVAAGAYDAQFPIDVFQTGSGTSTNMNANEVIAYLAARGGLAVHPNDHVNMGQSSNDVIPTAIHVAAALAIRDELLPALNVLEASLAAKSREFWPVIKTGRTHLQDATPIRLGQEFLGYAGQVERGRRRTQAALEQLTELALGGTAVGTGVGTHAEFAARVCARLATETGIDFVESDNHFQAQATLDN